VLIKYNPALHVIDGVVARVDVAPEGTPAPSLSLEQAAIEAAAEYIESTENFRASIKRKNAGYKDDFTGVTNQCAWCADGVHQASGLVRDTASIRPRRSWNRHRRDQPEPSPYPVVPTVNIVTEGTMNKSALLLIFTLILNGCATCREHPIACTAGVIAVGAVVAASSGSSSRMNGGY
jgi:hypothetical protein